MARIALAIVVFAGTLAGCTSLSALRGDDSLLSASIGDRLEPLAGHWQGMFSETGGWYYQGHGTARRDDQPGRDVDRSDRRLERLGYCEAEGRNVVLEGTARSATGHEEPVYLSLTGDDARRWGAALARFGEWEEPASVSLRTVS